MATKYLNRDSGSNGNSGNSAGAAYATLAYALSQLGAGDTLYIEASTTDYVWTAATLPDNVTLIGSVAPNPVTGEYVRVNAGGGNSIWQLSGSFTAHKIWFYNHPQTASSQFYPLRTFTGNRVLTFEDCIISDCGSWMSTASRGGIIGGGHSVSADQAASTVVTLRRCAFWNLVNTINYGSLVRSVSVWTVLFRTAPTTRRRRQHLRSVRSCRTMVARHRPSRTRTW